MKCVSDLKNNFKKIKFKLNEPLSQHTSFKIGGEADIFALPQNKDELEFLITFAKKKKIPIFIIGKGSNLLVKDKGIRGLVICLNQGDFKNIKIKDKRVTVGAGLELSRLLDKATQAGLGGLEFLAGIPATVGGALAMNAGISKKFKIQNSSPQSSENSRIMAKRFKNISDLVEDVTVMDYKGKVKTLKRKEIKFAYRKSNLVRYIILSTKLKLLKRSKKEIKNQIREYLNYRKNTQDLSHPSAGCIFKNPQGNSAGRLIDLCNLKGMRIGDACISKKHANFIINLGKAKASDVLRLMQLIKEKVRAKFKVNLEPEIKIVGED